MIALGFLLFLGGVAVGIILGILLRSAVEDQA